MEKIMNLFLTIFETCLKNEVVWPEEAFGIETSTDIRCRRLLFLVFLSLFFSASARWLIVSEQMPFCFHRLGLICLRPF